MNFRPEIFRKVIKNKKSSASLPHDKIGPHKFLLYKQYIKQDFFL
jgi:hypothetical protein